MPLTSQETTTPFFRREVLILFVLLILASLFFLHRSLVDKTPPPPPTPPETHIQVNQATFEVLLATPHIGEQTARKIIELRKEKPFKDFEDFKTRKYQGRQLSGGEAMRSLENVLEFEMP